MSVGVIESLVIFVISFVIIYRLNNSKYVLGHSYVMGEFHIHPRIILISDGRPTDFTESISDDCPQNETERVYIIN